MTDVAELAKQVEDLMKKYSEAKKPRRAAEEPANTTWISVLNQRAWGTEDCGSTQRKTTEGV